MKLIFLDVDGVLNYTHQKTGKLLKPGIKPADTLCPVRLKRLGEIVERTGALVVISSVWRSFATRDGLIDKLLEYGIKVVGRTRFHDRRFRGAEIIDYLESLEPNTVDDYVIIDDESDFYAEQLPHLYAVDMDYGLSANTVYKIVTRFNNPEIIKKRDRSWETYRKSEIRDGIHE